MRNNSPSRVFVTQESTQLNYGPAEQFGEIVFMTRDEISPVQGSLVNASIIEQMKGLLQTFNPEFDYIAPSGSPVVSGIAFMLLGQLGKAKNPIRVLRWSNRDHVYQPISIKIS